MADKEHLEILGQGPQVWNSWRLANPDVRARLNGVDFRGADLRAFNLADADLSDSDLSGGNLSGALMGGAWLVRAKLTQADLSDVHLDDSCLSDADFSSANLRGANVIRAEMRRADLSGADLFQAGLCDCDLSEAKLSAANLYQSFLNGANLSNADLRGADLRDADLSGANLSGADLSGADCSACQVFGVSAWKLKLEGAKQNNLVISEPDQPVITVDNIEVAQFIYLMLNNERVRDVINTVTSKAVLILGRFADPARKGVLDGLRQRLRDFDLLPIVFDFDRPTDKDYTETVQTLAGMSMFVIADITSPKSTPLELEATVRQFKIPYLPIIDISVDARPFAMLVDSQKSFHWVLQTLAYESKDQLLDEATVKEFIIDRALAKRAELRKAKNDEPEMLVIPKKRG